MARLIVLEVKRTHPNYYFVGVLSFFTDFMYSASFLTSHESEKNSLCFNARIHSTSSVKNVAMLDPGEKTRTKQSIYCSYIDSNLPFWPCNSCFDLAAQLVEQR